MKKIVAILLCLVLAVTATVVAFATESVQMTITPAKTSVHRGETVDFSISMSELEACRSAAISLEGMYDTSVFEFVEGSCTVPGVTLGKFGITGGKLSGAFAMSDAATVSGEVFHFKMRVKDDAPFGETTVSGVPGVKNSAGEVDVTANAAALNIVCNEMTVIPSTNIASRGEIVEFSIVMSELEQCRSAGFALQYDESLFEFVEGSCPLSGTAMENVGIIGGKLCGSFAFADAVTVSGEIFTFKMKVKDGAAYTNTQITAEPNARTEAGSVYTTINAVDMAIVGAQMYIKPAKTVAARGEVVDFTVEISELANCRSAMIALDYDESIFEFVSGRCTVSGVSMSKFGVTGGVTSGSFAFGSDTDVSGQIFTFQMKVKASAVCGDFQITGTASARAAGESVATAAHAANLSVHDWSAWESVDGNVHKHVCFVCQKEETAAHAAASEELVAGVSTHWYACVCGAKVEETAHVYDMTKWEADEANHWHACVCGAKTDIAAHAFTEEIIDDAHLVPGGGKPAYYYYDCAHCDTMGTESFRVGTPGDLDENEEINEDDAIYLLQYILMPDLFPVEQMVDYDGNGQINEDDAIYLLQHILMPDLFPLA